jgi:hypothetical protein
MSTTLASAAILATAGLVLVTPALADAQILGSPTHGSTVAPADDDVLITVELTTLEPATPEPGELVVLAGTITNVSDEPVRNVQALLRYDSQPIQARDDIGQVLADPELYWGWRPGHVYDQASEELAPGESVDFRLEMMFDTSCTSSLSEGTEPPAVSSENAEPTGLPCVSLTRSGVYAIGVDANVTTTSGVRTTGGTTRTVLPWLITAEQPVDVALLWPLTAPPGVTPAHQEAALAAADDSLRVVQTLTAADAPLTWALDPELVSTVCAATDCGDGTDGAQPGSSPAAEWYKALRAIVDGTPEDVLLLPAAGPDIESLARIDPGVAAEVAAESGARRRLPEEFAQFAGSMLTGAAWPAPGEVSGATLELLADNGADLIVLPQGTMTAARPLATVQHGENLTSAVLTDPVLDSAIQAATGGGDDAVLHLRQQWLAATALAVQDEQALAAATPQGWLPPADVVDGLVDVWTSTDWINPVGLSQLEQSPAPTIELATAPIAAGDQRSLPADYVRSVVALHADVAAYHNLLADPVDESDPAEPSIGTVVRAASTAWHADVDSAAEQLAEVRDTVSGLLGDVSIVVNATNTLSSNTGIFPVNVANGLDHAVNVRLALEPVNQDRMSIEQVETQRVEAGQQQTIQVRAHAVANGQVPVTVQLSTVDGTPLGTTQRTIVNATQYGTIGWFVVGGSALLFVGGLGWRMALGRRRNGADPGPGGARPRQARG